MKFVKSKYRKKALILLLLSFGMILTNLSLSLFNSPFLNNNYEEGNIIDFDDQNILPKTSDSLPSSNGVGDEVNISLHQSYLNNSFNTALSPSDSSNNSFSLPCPTDTHFNSSFTNVTIEDIYAPNKTIIIEDDDTSAHIFTYIPTAGSFNIYSKYYLVNFSTKLYAAADGHLSDIRVRILNSTWTGTANEPDDDITTLISYGNIQFDAINDWYSNYSQYFDPYLLDPSKTANNTFYIELTDVSDELIYWRYIGDGGAEPDDMNAYYEDSGEWSLIDGFPGTVDLTLKLDLAPLNNTPSPEQIGLKINNSAALGYGDGINYGYWESYGTSSNQNGKLNFTL